MQVIVVLKVFVNRLQIHEAMYWDNYREDMEGQEAQRQEVAAENLKAQQQVAMQAAVPPTSQAAAMNGEVHYLPVCFLLMQQNSLATEHLHWQHLTAVLVEKCDACLAGFQNHVRMRNAASPTISTSSAVWVITGGRIQCPMFHAGDSLWLSSAARNRIGCWRTCMLHVRQHDAVASWHALLNCCLHGGTWRGC